jgi:hypothetical protein
MKGGGEIFFELEGKKAVSLLEIFKPFFLYLLPPCDWGVGLAQSVQ